MCLPYASAVVLLVGSAVNTFLEWVDGFVGGWMGEATELLCLLHESAAVLLLGTAEQTW